VRDTREAMSEENVELVRRGFMAALQEDRGTALETLFRMIAKRGHSGMELERQDAITYGIQGGKIVRTEYFNDRKRGLAAVGLRE
jgi:hypothetical protein